MTTFYHLDPGTSGKLVAWVSDPQVDDGVPFALGLVDTLVRFKNRERQDLDTSGEAAALAAFRAALDATTVDRAEEAAREMLDHQQALDHSVDPASIQQEQPR